MKLFNVEKFDEVELIDPVSLKVRNKGEDYRYIALSKEMQREISRTLNISTQVSKKLYNLSEKMWKGTIETMASQVEDGFDLSSYNYVSYGTDEDKYFISITHNSVDKLIQNFESLISNYECTYFVNNNYVLQMTIPVASEDDGTSVFILDMDLSNGIYRGYNGVVLSDGNIITPSKPVISSNDFSEFVASNFLYEFNMSAKLYPSLIKNYSRDEASKIHLSVREVIDILNLSKIEIITDAAGNIEMIYGTSHPDKFKNFFNSFNMPFKSLKKSSLLRKSLKQNHLTLCDMLDIISEEYFSDANNVNGFVISKLLSIYYSMESDVNVVKEELKTKGV